VEIYERVERFDILVIKKGQQIHLMGVKESRKHSGFVFYSYFKNSAFTAVKRDAKF